jgi:hypothetical protein
MSRTKQTQRKQIGKGKTRNFGYSIMKPCEKVKEVKKKPPKAKSKPKVSIKY